MPKQRARKNYTFPSEMVGAVNSTAVILFAVISGFIEEDGYCYLTNKFLAKETRTTGRTIQRGLEELRQMGYIKTTSDDEVQRKIKVILPEGSDE